MKNKDFFKSTTIVCVGVIICLGIGIGVGRLIATGLENLVVEGVRYLQRIEDKSSAVQPVPPHKHQDCTKQPRVTIPHLNQEYVL